MPHALPARRYAASALVVIAACGAPPARLPRGEPVPRCPGLPRAAPTFDGREYLLPNTADPAWLVGGAFRLEWIAANGPGRGAPAVDRATVTVASDSVRALGRGAFTYPLQVRLERLGPARHSWAPPVRTWLVQQVHIRARGDTAGRFGLTIVEDVPRTLDGGGTQLTLTQLEANRFAAVWQSDRLVARRTWFGRRVLEPSTGYICAERLPSGAGVP